jgi:uroporphyrinogen-III decarboxylase
MFMVAEHPLDLVGVAAIIGAAGVTFGSAAVGVGVFRRGDQPHPNTQITSAQQTTTTVTQPEAGK